MTEIRFVHRLGAISLLLAASTLLFGQKPEKRIVYALHAAKEKPWHTTPEGRWDDAAGVPRTLYHPNYGPLSGTPDQAARTFLSRNLARFKMKDGLTDLRTAVVQETPAGHHVRYEQQFQGIPVYKSDVVVSISRENVVSFVSNNYRPGVGVPATQASITKDIAIQNARNHLQVKGNILGKEDAVLMIYAEEDVPHLAYRVALSCTEPRGAWEVFVDAQSGEVLRAQDIRMFDKPRVRFSPSSSTVFTNGTGNVFIPDPLTSADSVYGTPGYTDNNDADSPQLTAQLKLVTLKQISQNGSIYSLTGPYVDITDWDLPTVPPATATNPDSFRFTRSQTGFEDVNVYYNIDSSQRYLQALGFTGIQDFPLPADPHGVGGADNSYFDPNLNALTFGQGGVDDAEDADVIWHEYGHAIEWGLIPGFGDTTGGNEEGMIGEGWGDYWAGSYSRSVNNVFSRNFVFTWDAGFNGTTGSIWPGRPLNNPGSYPPNGVRGMEVHIAGEIWSSVLMQIWDDIGKEATDKLVLQSHYYLGTFATMMDAAQAILQADNDMFAGVHLQQIATRFLQRNFIPGAKFTHQPLKDSENLTGPFAVTAVVQSGYFPNASGGIKAFWGRDTAFTDSVTLTPTGNPNEYSGNIPGNGQPAHYRYYLSARNTIGVIATYPSGAPATFFSFYAGADTIRPTASHSPLNDQARPLWPPLVRVVAKDNIGIDSVWVDYVRQRGNLVGSFPLPKTDDTTFQTLFGIDTSQIIVGDSLFYRITVKDVAHVGNVVVLPDTGYYKFMVTKIKVLVGSLLSSSCRILYNALVTQNAAVDSLPWGAITANTLAKYDLVIASAGTNSFPNFTLRSSMVKRVEGGGRIWVEGGQVGSFYRKPDGASGVDLKFRREVLHDSAWISDAITSDLNLTSPSHPLFTTPNPISSPIAFSTLTALSDRDAMTLIPGDTASTSVAEWSGFPGSAGITINKPAGSLTPLTIFFPFALSSVTDSTVATKLIQNTLMYFYPMLLPTGVEEGHPSDHIPSSFALEQNYPNPFNPATSIRYQLPVQSRVSLRVYNILGQEVANLVDGIQSAGHKSVNWSAGGLASGVYFYRLNATSTSEPGKTISLVRKMILIR